MGLFYEPRERKKDKQPEGAVDGVFRAVGQSDPGCERDSNEDRFLLISRDDMAGYFVFDGMGGQPAGEAAAQISLDVINQALCDHEEGDLKFLMSHVISLAQDELLSRRGDPRTAGMGTTVVGVLATHDQLVVGAVGDSRAYRIKRGGVSQITHDHTLVQQLVDAGQLSPHDALVHPQSHILTRCLGSTVDFAVDVQRYRLVGDASQKEPVEWLLLCSDGLYSLVADEEMAAVVLNFSPEIAAEKLIEVARSRGGFDNITALVIPLRCRLAEWLEDDFTNEYSAAAPALPDVSEQDSTFLRATEEMNRSLDIPKVVRATALATALATIAGVIWFLVFTMRQG